MRTLHKTPIVFGLGLGLLSAACGEQDASFGSSSNAQVVGADAGQAGDNGGAEACTPDQLGDEAPVATATNHSIWPPNHKFHYFSVADCATAVNACGETLAGEFIWGSSDEPVNDIGDGNHEPDILFDDCERVGVRSERQGPRDGRVYKLGVRFVDAAGNATESECAIIVDHDQRGVEAEDSGESYRVTLDGTNGTLECDGITVPPPDEDAGSPGGDGDGDGDGDAPGDGDGDAPGDGDGDAPGDGDGDGDAPGDGDGDGDDTPPGDGDGDTECDNTDPSCNEGGDGDGDGDSGDGDGDSGDGDGDDSLPPPD